MFRLADIEQPRPHPVELDLGDGEQYTFTALWRYRAEATVARLAEQGDDAVVLDAIAGWEGVRDAEDNEIAFSEDELRRLLGYPVIRRALVLSYYDYLRSVYRGNWKRPSVS